VLEPVVKREAFRDEFLESQPLFRYACIQRWMAETVHRMQNLKRDLGLRRRLQVHDIAGDQAAIL
jgi:hypothetical protein